MLRALIATVCLGAAALISSHAQADFILQENFEGAATGNFPGDFRTSAASSDGPTVVVDDGSVFGSPNKYIRIRDTNGGTGGGGVPITGPASDSTFSVAFDLVAGISGATKVSQIGISNTAGVFGSDQWGNSFSTAAFAGELVTVSYLINESGSAVDYISPIDGSTVSLAANSFDAYVLNGSTLTYLGRQTDASDSNANYLISEGLNGSGSIIDAYDNIRVSTELEAVVPEPASLVLLGLGGLCLLSGRRRAS